MPAPLVPDEVDLTAFDFMPLDVNRLLKSDTWIDAADDPKVGHALICLWSESWHQHPAASLPDNDKVLARLAMCDAKTWLRIKAKALSGWILCSDGRFYHEVVAEKALEAWGKKRTNKNKGYAGALARWGSKQSLKDASSIATSNGTSNARVVLADSKREGEGEGEGHRHTSGSITRGSTADRPVVDNPLKPDGEKAEGKNGSHVDRWWDTNAGIEAKGREINFPPLTGELHGPYKSRIFDELARRKRETATVSTTAVNAERDEVQHR